MRALEWWLPGHSRDDVEREMCVTGVLKCCGGGCVAVRSMLHDKLRFYACELGTLHHRFQNLLN